MPSLILEHKFIGSQLADGLGLLSQHRAIDSGIELHWLKTAYLIPVFSEHFRKIRRIDLTYIFD